MKLSQQQYDHVLTVFEPDTQTEPAGRSCRVKVFASVRIWEMQQHGPDLSRDVALHDVSVGGLCIMQYQPMEYGRQFVVELPAKQGPPLYVVCVSRYCRQINDQLLAVGAEFVAPYTGRLPGDLRDAVEAA